MNLDDLMAVWRSQDAAPLHDVNKTLLHLALRQDEAKLQKVRRRERWMMYIISAGLVAAMAVFFGMMFYSFSGRRHSVDSAHEVHTGWDLVIPIVGAAAAVLWAGAMYVSQRAQALREQRFGESLRDQLSRRIAQLDYAATRAVGLASVLALYLPPWVCAIALILAGYRVNHKPISDNPFMLVSWIVFGVWSVAIGVWLGRSQVKQSVLPRKQRLEALLKELDAP
jgi:hypothetical protein